MITDNFPTIGETVNNDTNAAAAGLADTKDLHHTSTSAHSGSGLTVISQDADLHLRHSL